MLSKYCKHDLANIQIFRANLNSNNKVNFMHYTKKLLENTPADNPSKINHEFLTGLIKT